MPFVRLRLCHFQTRILVHGVLAMSALCAMTCGGAGPIPASQPGARRSISLPPDLLQMALAGDLRGARSRLENKSDDVSPDHVGRLIGLDEALKVIHFRQTAEESKKSRDQFDKAITIMPTFSDAYLNRARWRMDNWKLDHDWAENAERDILEAIRLNPDQKAEYLLGMLYADPMIGRLDEAMTHLKAASLIPLSYLEMGKILHQKKQIADAVQQVKRSITRFPMPVDYRYIAINDWSLEFPRDADPEAQGKRLDEMRGWAQLVIARGKRKRFREMGARQFEKIDALLQKTRSAVVSQAPAPPPSASMSIEPAGV